MQQEEARPTEPDAPPNVRGKGRSQEAQNKTKGSGKEARGTGGDRATNNGPAKRIGGTRTRAAATRKPKSP